MTLWQVDIHPKHESADHRAQEVAAEAAELGIADNLTVRAAHGYLLEGKIARQDAERIATELLVDPVLQDVRIGSVDDPQLAAAAATDERLFDERLIHVLPKKGVMDPVALSAQQAIGTLQLAVSGVRTLRKYWVAGLDDQQVQRLCEKVLANDSVEQIVHGALPDESLNSSIDYAFTRNEVPITELDDVALAQLSKDGHLYLSLEEMRTIQTHFRELQRQPTDVELETIAQTWSEHCSHKTLKGRIEYRDEAGERRFENLLKETVFEATCKIRETLGKDDWCVSVFEDNAGIVTFDDEMHVVFKVETHNHPSAIEPYGGANTGIGGVIRDPLGTGLGAKPICNTDVFCFANPDTPADQIPEGVLHPRRIMKGVVAGVRDYGNRMGIPTVNGAIYFDQRYLANPLVYCGNVGMIPVDKVQKAPLPGDLVAVLGGRTGRDGIHGATFSSAELTSESDEVSGGAVQIGNAITEKMVLDVLLAARDRGLYHAVTDCGAGGLSSAVGEMGEKTGAKVELQKVPLKYEGLSYTEIWISEAQERMVLAVPPENWDAIHELCQSEGVEITAIGTFTDSGRLELEYGGAPVADLDMNFLHDGRPPVVRQAVYQPAERATDPIPEHDATQTLHNILGQLNVASKEWVIRQYDHEVQAGSVVKPLVGVSNDGPSDAAVVRPRLQSNRGIVVSCGMNPHYGDWDTYAMAAGAIDEAIRNCVAVGAAPNKIAILDNFCWGNTERPETLGSLVRAALACHDMAIAMGTPFISGKDSLNNEFSYTNSDGKQTISIPSTLLISALGQVDDVRQCVTMDLKSPGNHLYLVGKTHDELGGSHFGLVHQLELANVPIVRSETARATFTAMHEAILTGGVRACHDLSEGGLAVALAEMCFAGGTGATIDLQQVPTDLDAAHAGRNSILLFAESHSRFLCEVSAGDGPAFAALMAQHGVPAAQLGSVEDTDHVRITDGPSSLIVEPWMALKDSWQRPLDW